MLFIRETWPALIVLLTLLILALWIADPAPPRHVSMATGPAGSSNEALGKKYAAYFAEQGITLKLVPTEGSVENVKRLQGDLSVDSRQDYCWMWTNKTTASTKLSVTLTRK